MSRKKHLPGPWRWSDDSPARNGDYTLSLVDADDWGILSCDGIENSPRDSDAALIAAAPDLLEAAEGIEVVYAELGSALPGIVNTPSFDLVVAAVKRAREAVKKAKGESA